MTGPYYTDESVSLFLGDCRELLPALDIAPDAAVVDPPYGYTSLPWDTWPDGWTQAVAGVTSSMWCFGSLRMFMTKASEFAAADWRMSHDVVWRKHNGSGFQTDRFRCVHELAAHWYRGWWDETRHEVPVTMDATRNAMRRKARPTHTGDIGAASYLSEEGGPRLRTTVIEAASMHGRAIHPTQKPSEVISVLLEYAVPPGGLVVDPFAGSGSTLVTARLLGRRAVGIELNERYAEAAARWLDQMPLDVS